MKLTVLVPNESYRRNAGARIRYGRLTAALRSHDVQLELKDIGQFDPELHDTDALLISKCHDARAQLAAIAGRRRGLQVGVDLFDDYFSQHHDARLGRFRRWLRDLSPWLSYMVTSTRAMADVAADYAPGVPVHLLNDAAPQQDNQPWVASGDTIHTKLKRAMDDQRIDLAWFGIGDNPYFPVGLDDISAVGGELASLSRMTNMKLVLTVLTNARSLNVAGLSQLGSLPVTVNVQEWSETAEAALLDRSFGCVLPVSAQPFSIAKSLNRAITALSSGNQLLSLGFPLYDQLSPFIYRDVHSFAVDIGKRGMRVSADRRDALVRTLDECSGAGAEATRLASFLRALPERADEPPGRVAVVHGISSSLATNQLAKSMGEATLASPYDLSNMDVGSVASTAIPLALTISSAPGQRQSRTGSPKGNSWQLKRRSKRSTNDGRGSGKFDLGASPFSVQLALYETVIEMLRLAVKEELAVSQLILSENSQIPFEGESSGPAR